MRTRAPIRRFVDSISTLFGFGMLDKEPLWYPSRNHFAYNPAIPDRQLWAIGMVAVQWGMTEWIIDRQIRDYVASNPELMEQYKRVRNFKQTLDFLETLIQAKADEPLKSGATILVSRIRDLASQRHDIMHRLWGGGMPIDSWSNPDNTFPETDASIMSSPSDKLQKKKSDDARATIRWRLTFSGIKRVAIKIAALNRDMCFLFTTPTDEKPAA